MKHVKLIDNNVVGVKETIAQFLKQGFIKDEIYLLVHDKERSEELTDAMGINDIGVSEEGVINSIANIFRSRGDELRSKIKSLGFTDVEAQQFEEELDRGRVVVIATSAA